MKKHFFFIALAITMLASCKKVKPSDFEQPTPPAKPSIVFVTPTEGTHFRLGDTIRLSWKSTGFGDQKINIMAGHDINQSAGGVLAWGIGNDLQNNGSIDVIIPNDPAMKGRWEFYTLASGQLPMAYRQFIID